MFLIFCNFVARLYSDTTMCKRIYILALTLMTLCSLESLAQGHVRKEYQYSYIQRFYFLLDKYNIDESISNNAASVDSILYKVRWLKEIGAEGIRIHVIGSASLEASEEYNARLAANRSDAFIAYMKRFVLINGVDIHADYGVYDWNVLYDCVSEGACPDKEALLKILAISNADISLTDRKKRIMELGNGLAYKYISTRYFHLMRYASIRVTADVMPQPVVKQDPPAETAPEPIVPVTIPQVEKEGKKFMVGVRTNMLMDAVMIPNIGLDVYLAPNWSIGLNWAYSWWKRDKTSFYWRAYGGDLHADYWFRKPDNLKWTGHHVGVYANLLTWDFGSGNTGYQAPKWVYGGGISYGYALQVRKHLSIDFGLGLGFLHGKQHKYNPGDKAIYGDKYFIQNTKKLNWFGPTKLEVSLIWKIGKE